MQVVKCEEQKYSHLWRTFHWWCCPSVNMYFCLMDLIYKTSICLPSPISNGCVTLIEQICQQHWCMYACMLEALVANSLMLLCCGDFTLIWIFYNLFQKTIQNFHFSKGQITFKYSIIWLFFYFAIKFLNIRLCNLEMF